jgi:small nuclear ribonucleoprotein (snRNP)-like protein
MKYVVELFDGRSVRGMLVAQDQLANLLSSLDQLDPSLGVIVLDVTPEHTWRANQEAEAEPTPTTLSTFENIDSSRQTPVDQMMV